MPISEAEKVDIKTAILYAFGVPMKEIAARLGREEMTLYKRRKRCEDTISGWLELLVTGELEKVIAERVRKIEQKADLKQQAYEKAWKLKLRALNQGLREGRTVVTVDGEEITIDEPLVNAVQASIAMNVVDRVEGRPIDRKAILKREELVSRLEVSTDDLEDFIEEVRMLMQPHEQRRLIEDATEAEIVGSPS